MLILFPYTTHASLANISPVSTGGGDTLKTGLVGWWTFDGKDTPWTSATAGTTLDKSGNNNTGTLVSMNRATAPVAGKIGQGFSFNGSTNGVFLGSPITTGTTFTYSAWIYPKTQLNSYGNLFTYGGSAGLWLYSSKISYYYGGNHLSNTPLALNKWHHIAVVNNAGAVTFYVDGSPDGTAAGATSFNADSIGKDNGGTTESFTGNMDDVRFYSRVLSAAEIKQLYNMGGTKINQPLTGIGNGLVGWWTFDGKNMKNYVTDSSGRGNNGALQFGTTGNTSTSSMQTPGVMGQGLGFDGVDDYVDVGNPANGSLDFGTGDFAVGAWFKVPSASVNGLAPIVDKRGASGAGYLLQTYNIAPYLYFFVANSSGTYRDARFSTNRNFQDNKWHYAVGMRVNNEVYLYLDGKNVTTDRVGTLTSIDVSNSHSFDIGRRQLATPLYFPGSLDDVRIYNRALSAAEITQLYNLGGTKINQPLTGISSGLVGYWTFDGKNMKNNVTDSSGLGNNGSLQFGTLGNKATSTMVTAGKLGQALNFDGVDDYVSAGNPASLNLGTGNFTMSAWVKANNAIGGWYSMLYRNNDWNSTQGYLFALQPQNKLAFSLADGVNTFEMDGVTALDNKWHFVVAVIDRSANSASHLYLDGKDDTRLNWGNVNTVGSIDNALALQIGKGFGGLWNGPMDDVRIYNRALSAAEITQLYNLGR